jgi:site-specific DNA-methyltransferase (adenine-specific)
MTIYNEDCLGLLPGAEPSASDAAPAEPTPTGMDRIADGSVDFILCDLPYGMTDNDTDGIDLDRVWAQYRRVIKPNGVLALTAVQPFTTTLGASNREWLRYGCVWIKSHPTNFLWASAMPLRDHEDVLIFSPVTLGNMTYNAQGLIPCHKKRRNSGHSKNWGVIGPKSEDARENGLYQEFENYPRTALHYALDRPTIHSTQKPVGLFEYLVRTYSNEGELVLDNTMGSGTTGVACMNSDREFIGFEMNPEFFDKAKKRLEEHAETLANRKVAAHNLMSLFA